MLNSEIILQRLEDMALQPDPSDSLWPENCAGSRKALVIFVGPSPGGSKEAEHPDINPTGNKPLWNQPYLEPLKWSRGFKESFKPIVEEIFKKPYEEAAKLIARFNMDWRQNPQSSDVSYYYMWEGCAFILPVLYECEPSLVIPMDEKTFGVLQIALYNDRYEIHSARIGKVEIRISDKRLHRKIKAFKADNGIKSFLVIKSMQHPARIYDHDYATRIGRAIRIAADQIWNREIVGINLR